MNRTLAGASRWRTQPARFAAWIVGLWLAAIAPACAGGFDHAHAAWTALLERHVAWSADGSATTVDYAGLLHDREALAAYTRTLATVDQASFDGWSVRQRQAFLVNAYNAYTVELVLSGWPDLDSIKDLGSLFRSPWSRAQFGLLGEVRSLDDIEHRLLRGAPGFAEPRIHFAVNCASVGCPALRPEAYTTDGLEAQLEDQARRFLSDRSRNRFDASARTLRVSKIFDWYEDDFAGVGGVAAFLAGHADTLGLAPTDARALTSGEIDIGYLDYDWSLNARR